MIKLIAFDLWHTLVDRKIDYHTTTLIVKLLHPHLSQKKIRKLFENDLQTKPWKSEKAAFRKFARDLGDDKDETVALLMALRDFADSKAEAYAYTLPLLKELKKKYKLALVSNTSIFDIKYMENTAHILKFFDYKLLSYKTGLLKPDTAVFAKLLQVSKLKPEEVLMIGDKISEDVTPAKTLGINAIHFKSAKQLKKDLDKLLT